MTRGERTPSVKVARELDSDNQRGKACFGPGRDHADNRRCGWVKIIYLVLSVHDMRS